MKDLFYSYINGQWFKNDGHSVPNINPSDTSDIIGLVHSAADKDCLQAIKTAKNSQSLWQNTPIEKKQSILNFIGSELISKSKEIGELLAREEGKTLVEGIGEVYRAGQFFHYYASEVLRVFGENANSVRDGVFVEINREPVGTVLVITPWNFPIALPCWKIAPALAYGNTVVFKPAEIVSASACALAEIIDQSDLPKGVFNMLLGSGKEVGNFLLDSPEFDAVTFTGSFETGKVVAQKSILHLTKIQLEMGSKNTLIINDDADISLGIQCAIVGAFFSAGQKCTASSRFLVHDKIYPQFLSQLLEKTKQLKVGHALQPDTQIGPVVSEEQLTSNLKYIELGRKEGAKLLCGGNPLKMTTEGFYMEPALFETENSKLKINQEEMFAPIASVIRVKDYEQALSICNDTDYGLTAGLITNSLKYAYHFKRNVKTGCAMINLPTAGTDYHVPFGGRKKSSYGSREQGTYAREFFTVVKTIYSKP